MKNDASYLCRRSTLNDSSSVNYPTNYQLKQVEIKQNIEIKSFFCRLTLSNWPDFGRGMIRKLRYAISH